MVGSTPHAETRLYRWQWSFAENEELGAAEAQSMHRFVRAHLVDGKVTHAETVKPLDEIELVVYYDQIPSDALMKRHQNSYRRIPMTVSLPGRPRGRVCDHRDL
jgi:hypothetical protein